MESCRRDWQRQTSKGPRVVALTLDARVTIAGGDGELIRSAIPCGTFGNGESNKRQSDIDALRLAVFGVMPCPS